MRVVLDKNGAGCSKKKVLSLLDKKFIIRNDEEEINKEWKKRR